MKRNSCVCVYCGTRMAVLTLASVCVFLVWPVLCPAAETAHRVFRAISDSNGQRLPIPVEFTVDYPTHMGVGETAFLVVGLYPEGWDDIQAAARAYGLDRPIVTPQPPHVYLNPARAPGAPREGPWVGLISAKGAFTVTGMPQQQIYVPHRDLASDSRWRVRTPVAGLRETVEVFALDVAAEIAEANPGMALLMQVSDWVETLNEALDRGRQREFLQTHDAFRVFLFGRGIFRHSDSWDRMATARRVAIPIRALQPGVQEITVSVSSSWWARDTYEDVQNSTEIVIAVKEEDHYLHGERLGPDGATYVWVPPGEFMMGADDLPEAGPVHRVRLTKGFWMGKTEVTIAQYRGFCQATGQRLPQQNERGDDNPVINVSSYDARAYCAHYGMRLPTEAQWEYAARGPENRMYPWGDAWDGGKCCNTGNRGPINGAFPAGSFPDGASWCGALDMAGNVWEWCADWYDDRYYSTSPEADPTGPAAGTFGLMRGGSWTNDGTVCRAAWRNHGNPPDYWNMAVGFRPVWIP